MEAELGGIEGLETVYFEGNPLQLSGPAVYRNKVRLALPQIKQIDASESKPKSKCIIEVGEAKVDTAFVRLS